MGKVDVNLILCPIQKWLRCMLLLHHDLCVESWEFFSEIYWNTFLLMMQILVKLHVEGFPQGRVLQYADTGKLNCTTLLWSEWLLELWRVILAPTLSCPNVHRKVFREPIGHGILADSLLWDHSFHPLAGFMACQWVWTTGKAFGRAFQRLGWTVPPQSCEFQLLWLDRLCPMCARQERALGRLWAWWQRASLWWPEIGGVWWLGLWSDPYSNPMNLASKISPAIGGTSKFWWKKTGLPSLPIAIGEVTPTEFSQQSGNDIIDLVQHLQLQNVVLLGHSLGGMIAPWQKVLGALGNRKGKNQRLEYYSIGGVLYMVGFFSPK